MKLKLIKTKLKQNILNNKNLNEKKQTQSGNELKLKWIENKTKQ